MKNEEDIPNDREINRKRKNSQDFQIPRRFSGREEEDNDILTLSLSFCNPTPPIRRSSPVQPPPQPLPSQALLSQLQPPLQLSPSHPLYVPTLAPLLPPAASTAAASGVGDRAGAGPSRPLRVRRNPTQAPREGKSDTVPAPFPWATTHRATVHSLNYLLSKQIFAVSGEVQCKRCERQYEIQFDLRQKFAEVGSFIAKNKGTMHDRAPSVWMTPVLPTCKFCEQENSVKPILSEKKKAINWLFLLLGQMLGCCTLEQLKYFCKHTKNHRTGAKDRVLYLTYLGLCKQLDPSGPFDR
ncbi:hypothetical protein RJ640_016434 [Escallonia rubra]|uniref:DUF7086 domain-containing protein n=1 Tax=Escallonia rubra TaxID=112253 RepID=A0AA88UK75_9ASTE|nr:hypothetical protein RJ640_016434 [Escallonia rubra]